MKRRYKISGKEEGRGKPFTRTFAKLSDLQIYVQERWQGVEYMDSPSSFHTDYVAYRLSGCTLHDLGGSKGPYGTDEYWQWQWFANVDLAGFNGIQSTSPACP